MLQFWRRPLNPKWCKGPESNENWNPTTLGHFGKGLSLKPMVLQEQWKLKPNNNGSFWKRLVLYRWRCYIIFPVFHSWWILFVIFMLTLAQLFFWDVDFQYQEIKITTNNQIAFLVFLYIFSEQWCEHWHGFPIKPIKPIKKYKFCSAHGTLHCEKGAEILASSWTLDNHIG